mmetsp:Transcript_26719/g.40389  ORF Transcript_26719/g.40389 Transcript_26719/m.40389 type:complete len:159 (-) Transcript_26719:96-572(-)
MTTRRNSHSSRRSRRSNDFSRNKRREKVEERYTNDSSEDDSSLEDDENQEERDRKIVELSVKAGLFLFGGLSLCFSTLFIPGVVPFLGGIFCGVNLIDPPPLDKLLGPSTTRKKQTQHRSNTRRRGRQQEDDDEMSLDVGNAEKVVKQALKTLFSQFF